MSKNSQKNNNKGNFDCKTEMPFLISIPINFSNNNLLR